MGCKSSCVYQHALEENYLCNLQYLLTGKLGGHKEDHALMITPTLVSTLSKKQPVTRMAWASKTSLVYAATQHEVSVIIYNDMKDHAGGV